MKRICKLDGQILLTEDDRRFAIYCTVNDCFDTVNDECTWKSAEELKVDFDYEIEHWSGYYPVEQRIEMRDRCVALAKGSGY